MSKKLVQFMNFDWDDNLIFMPTKIIYFAKDNPSLPQELQMSTEGFAMTRHKVGIENHLMPFKKVGSLYHDCSPEEAEIHLDLINYHVIPENESSDHSFREFRDCPENEYFMEDLKDALKKQSFGPSFNDFIYACSKKEIAKNVTIITARGHSPKTIYEGLKVFQELGLIKHLPLMSNIFPVSNPKVTKKFGGSAQNPSESKSMILTKILDQIQEQAAVNPDYRYCFGFSDDDGKTYALVEETFKKYISSGRWSLVEISLYFTGKRTNTRAILHCPAN